MFLPEESYEEINKLLILKKPLEPVDRNNILKNLNSLYELEDYLKEKIYDLKYPGLLPEINHILLSQDENSDEGRQGYNKNNNDSLNEVNSDVGENNIESIPEKRFKIYSNPNDIVTFNSNSYSTDDEDEFASIEVLNEDRTKNNENNWIFHSYKNDINVYYKINKVKIDEDQEVKVLYLYMDLITNINSTKFANYFNDNNFRKEFDNVYSKAEILEENHDEKNNLEIIDLYLYLKMPIIISDRDFTVRKKIWKDYNNKKGCYLIHLKSVKNEAFPEQKNPVRGNFIIRAAYICPYNDGEGEEKCKFSFVTCFDMKLNYPFIMITNRACEEQRIWAENLIENINKHERNK